MPIFLPVCHSVFSHLLTFYLGGIEIDKGVVVGNFSATCGYRSRLLGKKRVKAGWDWCEGDGLQDDRGEGTKEAEEIKGKTRINDFT